MAKGRRDVVMQQIPTIALGIVLLVGGFTIIEVVFKILGIVLLASSVGYFLYNYLVYKRNGVKIIK
jgi:ABC-type enterochelin transport system permease subunit